MTLQGQAGIIGKDVAAMAAGLRPVPIIEQMGATRIQAQGDVVLPVLPNRGCHRNSEKEQQSTTLMVTSGAVTLSPKRFAMRMDLTRQLLVQSAANLDAVIQADMANAIANKLDEDIISDIFAQLAAASKITNGSVSSTTVCTATDFADILSHEGGFLSQNPAGQSLALLMDPTMASYLKGVESSAGGQVANLNNNVLGFPVFTSTNVKQQTVVADTYFSGISSTTTETDGAANPFPGSV